jgi:hypothetical protein
LRVCEGMRRLLTLVALVFACSGGAEQQQAKQPPTTGEVEESDRFNREERDALSELLQVDVHPQPVPEEEPPTPPPSAVSSVRKPSETLRPQP